MTNPQFQFHTIRDIRKCWLHTPDNSFWVVDYMANETAILPLSVLWDDLSPADQERVFDSFLTGANYDSEIL